VRQETAFDERFLLLSSVGAAALVAASVARRAERPRLRASLAVACATAVLALAITSWQRGATYRDAVTFQRAWAETSPGNANARFAYGTALARAGDVSSAQRELETAVRLAPELAAAQFNLAVLLAEAGRLGEAAARFEAVLRANPRDADARANLVRLLELQGRAEEATAWRRGTPPAER
jgi:Flp pilus assembly protein TadD